DEGGDEAVEARTAASRLLQAASSTRDPRRRLEGAKALIGAGADRDELARRLLAMSSLLRDLGLLTARAGETALANADFAAPLQALLRHFDAPRILDAFATV